MCVCVCVCVFTLPEKTQAHLFSVSLNQENSVFGGPSNKRERKKKKKRQNKDNIMTHKTADHIGLENVTKQVSVCNR